MLHLPFLVIPQPLRASAFLITFPQCLGTTLCIKSLGYCASPQQQDLPHHPRNTGPCPMSLCTGPPLHPTEPEAGGHDAAWNSPEDSWKRRNSQRKERWARYRAHRWPREQQHWRARRRARRSWGARKGWTREHQARINEAGEDHELG